MTDLYNFNEFAELLEVPAHSRNLKQMEEYLLEQLKVLNKEFGIKASRDSLGNLYITKGEGPYPCMVAHYDENQRERKEYVVYNLDGVLMGWDTLKMEQCGAGFDDKCGVYACLLALKKYKSIKVCLFVDEEIGCIGSAAADMAFFSDCNLVIQLDKSTRTGNVFTTETNGLNVISSDFKAAVEPLLPKYGYKLGTGTVTDVGTLAQRGLGVVCFNMSCGYLHEHSATEICEEDLYLKSLGLADAIITKFGDKRWPHKAENVYSRYLPATTYTTYNKRPRNNDVVYKVQFDEKLTESEWEKLKNVIKAIKRVKTSPNNVNTLWYNRIKDSQGKKIAPYYTWDELDFDSYTDYCTWYYKTLSLNCTEEDSIMNHKDVIDYYLTMDYIEGIIKYTEDLDERTAAELIEYALDKKPFNRMLSDHYLNNTTDPFYEGFNV